MLLTDLLDLLAQIVVDPAAVESPAAMGYLQACTRILENIRHDCPDVLVNNHFTLLHAAPESAIQIRNIILSAVPTYLKNLPSPTEPGLRVDQIPGAKDVPVVLSDFERLLEGRREPGVNTPSLRSDVETFMAAETSESEREQAVTALANKIYLVKAAPGAEPEKVMHAVVLLVMKKAAEENKFGKQGMASRLLEELSQKLSMEELELLINAVLNELRFVSKYMWLASYVLLFLVNSPNAQ